MEPNRLRVSPSEAGQALLDFLSARCGCSRRKAKDLLDRRRVFVNQRRIWMAHHPLQAADIVEWVTVAEPETPVPETPPILYQDEHLLIADKPAGLLANGPHSLEALLRQALGIPELTAVHRLDSGTSGCLLFAKHAAARERLLPLFSERTIEKVYHALVSGSIHESHFTVRRPLAGQTAITDIQVLRTSPGASHLRIVIHTGRTHQIRKHLLCIGHPLIGEPYYATRRALPPVERRFARPMLHARQLSFPHPFTGVVIRCSAPLPDDFRRGLALFHLTRQPGRNPMD